MRVVKQIILASIFLNIVVVEAFAHETDTVHEEVPASVDPMLAIGVVLFVAIGAIIIWRVMFSKKKPAPTQVQQAQTVTPEAVQQSTQPEMPEAIK